MKRFSFKKTVLLILGVIILGIAIAAGFFSWRSYVIRSQEQRALVNAEGLIGQSRPNEALAIIKAMKASCQPENSGKWLSLEIRALEQSRNIPRLLYLYTQNPLEVLVHEKASLLVAQAMLETNKMDLYTYLRDSWRPREKSPELWFALDVDALLVQKRQRDAIALLTSRSFKGAADCGRLVRLALFKAEDNLDEAWFLLDEAYRADPRNPDVRSFRAQILEHQGRMSAARLEYVAAFLSNLKNPLLRDQLADFYRRQSNYTQALQIWIDGLVSPVPDFFWVKALFWSKVTHPVKIDLTKCVGPSGEMAPLIKTMQGLKEELFWDRNLLGEDVSLKKMAENRQEIFWLKLIQALQEGSEARAMELLKSSPFKHSSFHPELERTLETVLVYRRWGVFVEPEGKRVKPPASGRFAHQLFEQIHMLTDKRDSSFKSITVPDDLDALLKSKEAFSSVFLASGWLEAAIGLHKLPVIPDDFPDWVAYGFTQALRYNRGNKSALEFAGHQKKTPALGMLVSEILLADGRFEKALPRLESLAQGDTDIGFRAAWLMSMAYLDKGDLGESRRIVQGHKSLAGSETGREILAKIALNEGNVGEADRLYGTLAKESLEAKSYLARRAFERKDWKSARKYTDELQTYFPDMMELRSNVQKIAREEQNGRP